MAQGPFSFDVHAVREYMGLPTAGEDNLLAKLAAAVEIEVTRYLGRRSILNTAYAKTFSLDGDTTLQLFLPDYPVIASPAPTCAGDGTALGYGTDFGVELAQGTIHRLPATEWAFWPRGWRHVVVTWTAGLGATKDAVAEAHP